jgi:hypothetical protein
LDIFFIVPINDFVQSTYLNSTSEVPQMHVS